MGEILYTGRGGPGSRPYFQAAFDFATGTDKQQCMGDCYFLYEGSYTTSANGYPEFRDVQIMADTDSRFGSLQVQLDIVQSDRGELTGGAVG